jgi:hypothetical protein
MPNYSPNEFLYARPLAHAILTDEAFRRWFLAKTKFADLASDAQPIPEQQARLRTTPRARQWWWFNYFCHNNCSCKVATGIETDVLIVFETREKFRFALHVEVKRPGDDLKPGQAESYPRRARCWANPATRPGTVLAHDDSTTVLVCGNNLRADNRRSEFDDTKFHGDIEQRLSQYPDLIDLRDTK